MSRLALLMVSSLMVACGGSSSAVEPTVPETPSADGAAPALDGGGEVDASDAPLAGDYVPPPGDAWETITPAKAGFDAAKLDAVSAFVEQSSSTTFMMLYDGRIVVEKYWAGSTATTLRDIASAQKSISSLMVGAAVASGAFGLDDTLTSILGDGWSNGTPADEAGITVRHILTMTSGLTANLEHAAAPGAAWLYNTDAYHRLDLVLAQKTGKSLQDFTRAALFDPIGAGASAWTRRAFQKDAKGVPINALEMNARDMARVGLLVARDGSWKDRAVVPSSYLALALAPSQSLNTSYGFLFWLNGQSNLLVPPSAPKAGMLIPSAPEDVVAALGAGDQKIYVSRASRLVVVRQGDAAGGASAALSGWDDQLWQRIMAARLP